MSKLVDGFKYGVHLRSAPPCYLLSGAAVRSHDLRSGLGGPLRLRFPLADEGMGAALIPQLHKLQNADIYNYPRDVKAVPPGPRAQKKSIIVAVDQSIQVEEERKGSTSI
ncbi:hypothetical protein T310_1004 [Rasamsonia emersonii CBS 393.64]|uniref:Uncharacterized protein n=1 Tax=Rasamsonia emersonii (strain ATCC 16479 / CBS 393.64 / IMI 116815) TaxID=1408163 RepID=A0A0F4Z3P1_RASE3|nr:hypothetical protein T310_1004 [Rasamsonia emersonii CBS 393.64]KKA24970.1 hypothetical protein T310_1004 [Rasamsonia emersonii CBS 393.64]